MYIYIYIYTYIYIMNSRRNVTYDVRYLMYDKLIDRWRYIVF